MGQGTRAEETISCQLIATGCRCPSSQRPHSQDCAQPEERHRAYFSRDAPTVASSDHVPIGKATVTLIFLQYSFSMIRTVSNEPDRALIRCEFNAPVQTGDDKQ